MSDDIVARLRDLIVEDDEANRLMLDAADKIDRLRAELAAERAWKRANVELAEQAVALRAERDALRAELAAAKALAKVHLELSERHAQQVVIACKERDALREALREAYNYRDKMWPVSLSVRIDAALKGGDRD